MTEGVKEDLRNKYSKLSLDAVNPNKCANDSVIVEFGSTVSVIGMKSSLSKLRV